MLNKAMASINLTVAVILSLVGFKSEKKCFA